MEHRHLTPHEFDLLVDGEEGFGVAPLLAHVEQCAACRQELEAQSKLVASLEQLPHLTPSPLFAYRVMSQVQVFEPWHVAASNAVQRLIPRSRPARLMAAGIAGLAATGLTAGTVWLASRLDTVAFVAGVGLERIRGAGSQAVTGMVASALGSTGVSGTSGLAMAASGFLAAVAIAAVGLRAMAAVSRRRRM